jgi:hypothetical protein
MELPAYGAAIYLRERTEAADATECVEKAAA